MTDKLIYAILGITVGGLLASILRPSVDPIGYPEIIVHEIRGEPTVEVRWRDRVVYRDREPEVTVTQPGGGVEIVEQFCRDTLVITATDTVVVPATPTLLLRSVATDAGWFFQKDRVRLYGPVNTGALQEIRYVSWPGWEARADGDHVLFREPRLGWIKPIIEYGSVAGLVYMLTRIF